MILNLTGKSIFFKYAPMYLAFSLIQISREKFLDKTTIKPKLFFNLVNAYGINPDDYKECYEEVVKEIKESSNQENDIDKKRNTNNINKKEINNEFNPDHRTESAKKSSFNSYKNIYVPTTKIRSSNALIRVNANLLVNNSTTKEDNMKINT
jgi:alanyl-tRNA synthetase